MLMTLCRLHRLAVRLPRARGPALGLVALTFLPACVALWPDAMDRGIQVSEDRLRQVEVFPWHEYARPGNGPGDERGGPAGHGADQPAGGDAPVELRRDDRHDAIPITIEEARAAALAHNLDLRVAFVNPEIARQRLSEEEARFEALFATRALWSQTDTPTALTLVSPQQETHVIEPAIRIPLRTGGTAAIALPFTRTETNNPFATLNPAYEADLEFSISHALLRNAGRRVNATAIEIASYNRQISEAQTKLAVIEQLAQVERAYWRLYQSRRALEVRQQDYEAARAQLERARRMVQAGQQPEVELIRAQAGVAQRLGAIIGAHADVQVRQRDLKRMMNRPGLDVDSPTMVIPTTDPDPVAYVIDVERVMAQAIASRMELLEVELRLLADAAGIRLERSALLPRLDVDATYRINGLGRSGQDALRLLERNRFEDWSLGMTLEVPLGNEAARSRLRQALLTRLQRLDSRDARRQIIRQEVCDAVDRLQANWQRILAAREAVVLSARELAAEQRQFEVGAATSTDVLLAGSRLAQAQLDEIAALVDYQIAQVDLAAAAGMLLGATRVRWSPAEPPTTDLPTRD